MDFSLIVIIGALILYFLVWRLYLLIAPKIMPDSFPEYVRNPKFWQFVLAMFALGTIRKKLDI